MILIQLIQLIELTQLIQLIQLIKLIQLIQWIELIQLIQLIELVEFALSTNPCYIFGQFEGDGDYIFSPFRPFKEEHSSFNKKLNIC